MDPAREDPDVDVGSLDPVLAPFNGPKSVTGTWEGKLAFDDIPYLYAGALKGGVSATGATAKRSRPWTGSPARSAPATA